MSPERKRTGAKKITVFVKSGFKNRKQQLY
ncbi:MAG: hypothetical protein HPZ91_14870 [Lentisphaeria bacterium]|nr:hypothetical protein [Lentisphaeria bacterium]